MIAPKAGGVVDSVMHEKTGYLYNPRDMHEAMHFFAHVIKNPELCQKLGLNAVKWIDNHSSQVAFNNWISILQGFVGEESNI